jgi:hypothetical protein
MWVGKIQISGICTGKRMNKFTVEYKPLSKQVAFGGFHNYEYTYNLSFKQPFHIPITPY